MGLWKIHLQLHLLLLTVLVSGDKYRVNYRIYDDGICDNLEVTYSPPQATTSQEIMVDASCTGHRVQVCPVCHIDDSQMKYIRGAETQKNPQGNVCHSLLRFRLLGNDPVLTQIHIECTAGGKKRNLWIPNERGTDYGKCSSDQDCKNKQMICTQGQCSCPPGQIYVQGYDRCSSQGTENGKCYKNEDCTNTQMFCIQGQCTCPPGQIYVQEYDRCYNQIMSSSDPCDTREQCEKYAPGSFCNANLCSCPIGQKLETSPQAECKSNASSELNHSILYVFLSFLAFLAQR